MHGTQEPSGLLIGLHGPR
jgi:hypothetical protein